MSLVKNQHYVPRFYLRNFCNSKEQIVSFDKINQRCYFTSIKNVANENYFYENEFIDQKANVEQYLEKYFHPLEDRIAKLLRKLIRSFEDDSFIILDQDSRADLSLFLIYQFVRTKEVS